MVSVPVSLMGKGVVNGVANDGAADGDSVALGVSLNIAEVVTFERLERIWVP